MYIWGKGCTSQNISVTINIERGMLVHSNVFSQCYGKVKKFRNFKDMDGEYRFLFRTDIMSTQIYVNTANFTDVIAFKSLKYLRKDFTPLFPFPNYFFCMRGGVPRVNILAKILIHSHPNPYSFPDFFPYFAQFCPILPKFAYFLVLKSL